MSTYVDVHLVIDSFDRQFNMWRNVARLFARTDYVMMLDVDFYICTDIRSAVRGNQAIMAKLRDGLAAIVIPAFEYVKYSDGMDPAVFPRGKQVRRFTCRREVRLCSRRIFRLCWVSRSQSKSGCFTPLGHLATTALTTRNSTRHLRETCIRSHNISPHMNHMLSSSEMDHHGVYPICLLNCHETSRRCDERFVGYGGNKAACHFEMYISGISYFVLSDHFIIHQNHRYEEVARKNEVRFLFRLCHSLLDTTVFYVFQRRHNRRVYLDFKEETCLRSAPFCSIHSSNPTFFFRRYLKKYQDQNLLNTPRASNAQQECKNIKRVAKIAAEVFLLRPDLLA